jgi:hypothetical protein
LLVLFFGELREFGEQGVHFLQTEGALLGGVEQTTFLKRHLHSLRHVTLVEVSHHLLQVRAKYLKENNKV